MSILSDINKKIISKEKDKIVEAIFQVASHLVTKAMANLPLSQEDYDIAFDREVKALVVEFKILLSRNDHSFDKYVDEYIDDLRNNNVESPKNRISKETLRQLGVETEKGKITARAATHMASRLGKASSKVSFSDFGIKISPKTENETKIPTSTIGKAFSVFSKKIFDPNIDKTSSTFGSAQKLDRGAFNKDDQYQKEMLMVLKHIEDNIGDATKEEKLLAKEIKKLAGVDEIKSKRKEAEEEYKSLEGTRARMTPGAKAILDVSVGLIGLSKKGFGAIGNRLKKKKNVDTTTNEEEQIDTTANKEQIEPKSASGVSYKMDPNDSALEEANYEDKVKNEVELVEFHKKEIELLTKISEKEPETKKDGGIMDGIKTAITAAISGALGAGLIAMGGTIVGAMKTGMSFLGKGAGVLGAAGVGYEIGTKVYENLDEDTKTNIGGTINTIANKFGLGVDEDEIRETNRKHNEDAARVAAAYKKKRAENLEEKTAKNIENKENKESEKMSKALSPIISQSSNNNVSAPVIQQIKPKDAPRNPDSSLMLYLNSRVAKFF